MRVSRTRFSKRRLKRKTEFPIVAVVQKKRKSPSIKSQSFTLFRKETMPEGRAGSENNKQGAQPARAENQLISKDQDGSQLSFSKGDRTEGSNIKTRGLETSKPQKKSRATIDYKNIILLRNLITAEGKILPRRINKLTAKQQRYVQKAIKSARIMGLLPFINKSRPF